MGKFYGTIGFAETQEVKPGVWKEVITERKYFGELMKFTKFNLSGNDQVNKDVRISNEVKIVADPFALNNFYQMRYIEIFGVKWITESVEPKYPSMIITTGGIYNG